MELDQLMQEGIESQEKDFYSKKFYYSYSSLNKLLWNPQVFYQMYVLGIKDEKTDAHLVQGKLIHLLLLEPEKFNDVFVLSPSLLPSSSVITVIERVYRHHEMLKQDGDQRTELNEFSDIILDVMRSMNFYQNLSSDKQRIDKIVTKEALSYWEFLKTKQNKTLIDQDSYDFCNAAVTLVKTNKKVCDLIGCNVTDFDNKEVINELLLKLDLPGKSYGLKGIIDNIVIDHDDKMIYINDIKTTSKDLKDFSESVEYYSYWMQATIYMIMLTYHFESLVAQGYNFKFHFVVIDRTFQTYAFPVSDATSSVWLERFKEAIDAAEWHYVNRSYELPRDFATGAVVL